MICAQVAVLTDTMRVVGSIWMRTLVGRFLTPSSVVAILAHTFRVELQVGVRTGSYELLVLLLP